MKTKLGAALGSTSLVLAIVCQGAVSPLITHPGTGPIRTDGGQTIGPQFTVGSLTLQVDALGIWDRDSNGLLVAHDVGIWQVTNFVNKTGILIASVTVPAGTAAPVVGEFRYASLPASIFLTNGLTYQLGAFYDSTSGEPFREQSESPAFSPLAHTYIAHWVLGTSLSKPVNPGNALPTNTSYVGPNLLIVPEPVTTVLLLCGAALLWQRRRTHRV